MCEVPICEKILREARLPRALTHFILPELRRHAKLAAHEEAHELLLLGISIKSHVDKFKMGGQLHIPGGS